MRLGRRSRTRELVCVTTPASWPGCQSDRARLAADEILHATIAVADR